MDTLTSSAPQQANLMCVLRQLIEQENISVNALAKQINLPTPTVNRLLTGEVQDPRASTLIEIANYFGITINQLLGITPLATRSIAGKHTARPPLSIPLLSMIEAAEWENYLQAPAHWFYWQIQNRSDAIVENDKIFAVTIKTDLYTPTFLQGALVIVNPVILPSSGDYVLIRFNGDVVPVIKKYISEGQYKYLYPLQAELKTISFDENDCQILGVIIASYISYKE